MTNNESESPTFPLTEREKEYWTAAIEQLLPEDKDWFIGMILHKRALTKRAITPLVFKICDKCNSTYPEYTLTCTRCGLKDKYLREFSIEPNKEAILGER